ncbi:hypothetical protein [Arthrobacter psychrochitiniphilus]|uniref:Uncharacterized protein n=1 Tax=Arthrobacter psychrochitiniphilus TaxID=291045 RepID=A0A2V3DSZ1_9MICC|nr:hypothetical protein [Arthrobacter psychrochitiniphilus]NYG18703.1 hypothetical protein [Arthrobacter psychrochitiniphilus]PXA66365.1 hypothetical protein CVS29_06670 [Arthrobacter psychrochitiniphilus]
MHQQQEPEGKVPPSVLSVVQEAYGRGYLEGHLAGWRDAVAAQAGPSGPASAPVLMPPVNTTAAPLPPRNAMPPPNNLPPPNVMPRTVPRSLPPLQQVAKPVVQDPAVAAERKRKREVQNINITLYVASLLMVAAAALFVGSSQPVPVRLVGVWFATILFYGAGLLLHAKVPRLKPAAVAFAGTALAIIPFAGLATYNLGFPDGPAVWLATSLIGTVAYAVAAVRLQSRLVVYLSLAFLLSTAWSSVAVLGAALAWYFAALIVFSALLSLAGYLLQNRGSEPGLYAKPLSDLGPWFAPAGLLGSLIFSLALNAFDHTLVLVAGVIFYAVMCVVATPALRRWNYLGLRLSATLAAPFIGWLIQPEFVWAAASFTVVLAVQILTIAYSRNRLTAYLGRGAWVDGDVLTSAVVLAVSSAAWTAGLAAPWSTTAGQWPFAALGLAVGLVATMAVVPIFLPKGEWLPLPAATATLLCWLFLSAADAMVLLSIGLIYSLLRYRAARGTTTGHIMLIIARVLVSALAAATLAHFIPAQPGKVHLILAAMGVICALQLLADAMLAKFGAANSVTNYSAAAWATAGTALVILLSVTYVGQNSPAFPGITTLPLLRWEFLVSALAMGLATVVFSLVKLPRTRGFSRAEIIAPSYLFIVALGTGPVFDAAGASVAWGAALVYLLVGGFLLRRQEKTLHRWVYWWGARAVSLLMAIALYQLWQENNPATTIFGTAVGLGTFLLLALVPQILILSVVAVRGRAVSGLCADVLVTLLAAVMLVGVAVIAESPGLWTARLAVVLATAALAVLATCGTMRSRQMPAVLWSAPVALWLIALIALIALADRPLAVMVLGILTATSALVAARAGSRMVRGSHFLLARVAVTMLVGEVVRELTDNAVVITLVLTVVLLLQLGLQAMADTRGRFNTAVGEDALLRAGLWLLLTALLVLPVAYVLQTRGFDSPGTALRWVVALELLALAGSAVVAQVSLKARGAAYLLIVALMGGAVLLAPLMWPGATALILLALCVAAIAWRCVTEPKTEQMRWYWLIATGCFLATACVVDSAAATGIFAAMWLVAGTALVVAAHIMKTPWLTLPGSLMVLLSAFMFRSQVLDLVDRPGYAALAGFVVVLGALYIMAMVLVSLLASTQVNRAGLIAVALGGGGVFALWAVTDETTSLLGAAAFTGVAVLACVELPTGRRRLGMDAAVLSSALVWFWASTTYIDLGVFWFVQWCALAFAVLAMIRYRAKELQGGKTMLMVAAVAASLGGLLTIVSGDTLQQVISLLVFVALLAVGMALEERIFTIWGAVGVATAVIWYLRGFTYILLALLALALIALAIWRLNRKKPLAKTEAPLNPNGGGPAGMPGVGQQYMGQQYAGPQEMAEPYVEQHPDQWPSAYAGEPVQPQHPIPAQPQPVQPQHPIPAQPQPAQPPSAPPVPARPLPAPQQGPPEM